MPTQLGIYANRSPQLGPTVYQSNPSNVTTTQVSSPSVVVLNGTSSATAFRGTSPVSTQYGNSYPFQTAGNIPLLWRTSHFCTLFSMQFLSQLLSAVLKFDARSHNNSSGLQLLTANNWWPLKTEESELLFSYSAC
jgi:hypothetical protein